jgi:hypothetical protein
MPSSFLHTLLPATCATTARRPEDRSRTLVFFALCAFLANAPDLDIVVGLILGNFERAHRAYGHNLIALAFWMWLGTMLFKRFTPWLSRRAGVVTAVAMVLSHVFLDSMTIASADTGQRVGVPLFWPFVDTLYSFPGALFGGVPPQHKYANPLLDRILSPRFWREYLGQEALWGVIFFLGWYGLLLLGRIAGKNKAPAEPGLSH